MLQCLLLACCDARCVHPQAQVDPKQTAAARWRVCSYSGEPLDAPVVVDELGNMFNKAAVLEGMLT